MDLSGAGLPGAVPAPSGSPGGRASPQRSPASQGVAAAGQAAGPADVAALAMPSVDVLEYPDRYEVYADLPGVERDDIQVWFERGTLTLRAPRSAEAKPWRWLVRERSGWARDIVIGVGIDENRVEAQYSNGVLHIELPKTQEARLRVIPVSGVRVRPLGRRVLVRRLPEPARTGGGLFIPEVARHPSHSGVVVAVGDRVAPAIRGAISPGDVVFFEPAGAIESEIDKALHVFVEQDALVAVVSA